MKVLTYLLAMTIALLSVKSGIESISFSDEQALDCCSTLPCAPDSESEEDQNEKGLCNPFQSCCSYSLMCQDFAIPISGASITKAQHLCGYQVSTSCEFTSSLWQPPRFV